MEDQVVHPEVVLEDEFVEWASYMLFNLYATLPDSVLYGEFENHICKNANWNGKALNIAFLCVSVFVEFETPLVFCIFLRQNLIK